jgi:outer membrane protein assembly factor BamB
MIRSPHREGLLMTPVNRFELRKVAAPMGHRLMVLAYWLLLVCWARLVWAQRPIAVDPARAQCASASTPDQRVLTQHNDNQRTGATLSETCLTVRNVNQSTFGLLYWWPVDGQIYAQPLFMSGITASDGTVHNAVYVATMNNTVYAFDADDPKHQNVLWTKHLGDPVDFNFFPMYGWFFCKFNIYPTIGITSTPVIDTVSKTLYVVAKIRTEAAKTLDPSIDAQEEGKTVPRGCYDIRREQVVQRLYALDVGTGENRSGSPTVIAASFPGLGTSSKSGSVAFDSVRELQRSGLLLSHGTVYIAFGSHQDTRPFHGWILAYDAASLSQVGVYCTSCMNQAADENGIWQAGAGPAADKDGNIYVMTGNGTWKGGTNDLGNSFLKLDPLLSLIDWFTPSHHLCLSRVDADLGSAGPLLIPNSNFLVGGGKEGVVYLLNARDLGRLQPPGPDRATRPCAGDPINGVNPPVYSFQATPLYHEGALFHKIFVRLVGVVVPARKSWNYHHIHGSPVYWNSSTGPAIYLWAERDSLRGFPLDLKHGTFPGTSRPNRPPRSAYISSIGAGKGMPGAALSISANGNINSTGIVWASLPHKKDALVDTVDGILRAFAAVPEHPEKCGTRKSCILPEIWNSRQPHGGDPYLFAKYASPTIANGKVYLPTFSGRVNVYGPLEKGVAKSVTTHEPSPLPRR